MKELLLKYKEIIMYLIFGVLTTVVNIAVYYIMANSLQIHYLISNIVAWFLSVLFAYVTNRKYVFESKSEQIIKEMTSFFGARLATGAMDMVLMWLFVGLHILPDFAAKVITNVIVIIANYILSKLVVFKGE
ncbi:GtrA family protein [[Clostridium] spiroforme]|nr:GtrA family protein [Thomasclavelia spiroformis]